MDRQAREGRIRGGSLELPAGGIAGNISRGSPESIIDTALARSLDGLRRPAPFAAALGLALGFSLLVLLRHGFTFVGWTLVPVAAALGVIVVADLRSLVVPDVITLPGIAYALVAAATFGFASALRSGLGILVAGAVLLAFAVLTRGGIGGGDIKLVAMLGGVVGWQSALLVFALSQVAGLLWITGRTVRRRRFVREPLPIGAVIAVVGVVSLAVIPLAW